MFKVTYLRKGEIHDSGGDTSVPARGREASSPDLVPNRKCLAVVASDH